MQKFTLKNRKKAIAGEERFFESPHGFCRDVDQKTMSAHKREGGQKCPKFCPHGLWMPPFMAYDINDVSPLLLLGSR